MTETDFSIAYRPSSELRTKQLGQDDTFVGETDAKGKPHGIGLIRRLDTQLYLGEFKKGLFDGIGTYQEPGKTSYFGEWREGNRDGIGELKSRDQEVIGFFRFNQPAGICVIKDKKSNRVTKGSVKLGKPHGFCFVKSPDLLYTYRGLMGEGLKEGSGVEIDSTEQTTYKGQYSKDKKHGVGFFRVDSVRRSYSYFGFWDCDAIARFGVETDHKLKTIYEGQFEFGAKTGVAKIVARDFSYLGEVEQGLKHGFGKYEDDYQSFTGDWLQDKRSGLGLATWVKDERRYFGEWRENLKEGLGYEMSSKEEYRGYWRQGRWDGLGVLTRGGEVTVGNFRNGALMETSGKKAYLMKELDIHTFSKKSGTQIKSFEALISNNKASLERSFQSVELDFAQEEARVDLEMQKTLAVIKKIQADADILRSVLEEKVARMLESSQMEPSLQPDFGRRQDTDQARPRPSSRSRSPALDLRRDRPPQSESSPFDDLGLEASPIEEAPPEGESDFTAIQRKYLDAFEPGFNLRSPQRFEAYVQRRGSSLSPPDRSPQDTSPQIKRIKFDRPAESLPQEPVRDFESRLNLAPPPTAFERLRGSEKKRIEIPATQDFLEDMPPIRITHAQSIAPDLSQLSSISRVQRSPKAERHVRADPNDERPLDVYSKSQKQVIPEYSDLDGPAAREQSDAEDRLLDSLGNSTADRDRSRLQMNNLHKTKRLQAAAKSAKPKKKLEETAFSRRPPAKPKQPQPLPVDPKPVAASVQKKPPAPSKSPIVKKPTFQHKPSLRTTREKENNEDWAFSRKLPPKTKRKAPLDNKAASAKESQPKLTPSLTPTNPPKIGSDSQPQQQDPSERKAVSKEPASYPPATASRQNSKDFDTYNNYFENEKPSPAVKPDTKIQLDFTPEKSDEASPQPPQDQDNFYRTGDFVNPEKQQTHQFEVAEDSKQLNSTSPDTPNRLSPAKQAGEHATEKVDVSPKPVPSS